MLDQDIAILLKICLQKGPKILSKKRVNRDGRSTILEEIADSPSDLRKYLADAASSLLSESAFLDVLPGFVLDEGRVPLVRERLGQLTLLTPVVL